MTHHLLKMKNPKKPRKNKLRKKLDVFIVPFYTLKYV